MLSIRELQRKYPDKKFIRVRSTEAPIGTSAPYMQSMDLDDFLTVGGCFVYEDAYLLDDSKNELFRNIISQALEEINSNIRWFAYTEIVEKYSSYVDDLIHNNIRFSLGRYTYSLFSVEYPTLFYRDVCFAIPYKCSKELISVVANHIKYDALKMNDERCKELKVSPYFTEESEKNQE